MQQEFRDRLLLLVQDDDRRAGLAGIESDREFALALTEHYREETGLLLVQALESKDFENSEAARQYGGILARVQSLSGNPEGAEGTADERRRTQTPEKEKGQVSDALSDSGNAVVYAEFLFLTDTLSNVAVMGWGITWLQSAIARFPDNPELKYVLAAILSFLEPKDLPPDLSVQKVLRDSLLQGPDNLVDLYDKYLSFRERYQQRFPALLEWFVRAARPFLPHEPGVSELDMINSFYHAFLAEQYTILGYLRDAEMIVDRALTLWPGNPYALAMRGQIGLSRETHVQVTHDFQVAVAKAERLTGIFRLAGYKGLVYAFMGMSYQYYRRHEYESSIRNCDRALALNLEPYFAAMVHFNRARSQLEARRFSDAQADLKATEHELDIVEKAGRPENVLRSKVHLNRGLIWHERGLNRLARAEYEQAIQLNADLAEAYNNLGTVCADEGKMKQARKLFQTAVSLDPSLSEAAGNLESISRAGDRDWWKWWFGSGSPLLRKIFGAAIAVALLAQLVLCFRQTVVPPGDVRTGNLVMVGILALIMVLPIVQHVKVGDIELDLKSESKGQHPVSE